MRNWGVVYVYAMQKDKFGATLKYYLDSGQEVSVHIDYYKYATQRLELGGFSPNEDITQFGIRLFRTDLIPRYVTVKLKNGSTLNVKVKTLEKYLELRNNPKTELGSIIRCYGENFFRFGCNFS